MSNTRHAAAGAPLSQNRYCSSPKFEVGLLGNLVTKRCQVLADGSERALIQSLQWFSHQEGGLAGLAAQLIAANPDAIATRAMLKIGAHGERNYTASQVRQIRADLPQEIRDDFLLKGECYGEASDFSPANLLDEDSEIAQGCPESYPSSSFKSVCLDGAAADLEDYLAKVSLDPFEGLSSGPWYFPGIADALRRHIEGMVERTRSGIVMTQLSQAVFDALEYGLQGRCMVVVEGLARTGKTYSAQAWCRSHPGEARYVQCPSTGDDIGFFRAISEGLGTSSGSCVKATQMREKIEDTLQGGHIMVVFDEAHYLLPQRNLRYAIPNRLNWVMTALVNRGIPVAMVTTPQFGKSQKAIEKKTGWASEQFIGRIGHWERLPDRLSESDLEAVARHLLPTGDSKCISALVAYSQGSSKYLAGIESAARRAKYLASRSRRDRVTFADVKDAIQGSVIPSDTALAKAFGAADRERHPRFGSVASQVKEEKGFSVPLQPVCTPSESLIQGSGRLHRQGVVSETSSPRSRVTEMALA